MRMRAGSRFLKCLVTVLVSLHQLVVASVCNFSFLEENKIYNYTLTSATRGFPHGILSEDGFYKVAVNNTILWFQLCDGMIFNHDPPRCADCLDCGGPTLFGMNCSALVSNNIGGYHVCTTIGRGSKFDVDVIDKKNPRIGVNIKMSSSGPKLNCSLSVSVLCDSNGIQGPHSLEKLGTCDYVTELKHPSGCAIILDVHDGGWRWFATSIIIVLCLFGAYLLAGIIYRSFALGIRGIDVIPNLDFWASIPRRIQGWGAALVRKINGPSQGYRTSYSPVKF